MSEVKEILVTRDLSGDEIAFARSKGLEPLMEPAIRVTFSDGSGRTAHMAGGSGDSIWVFTSRNGVEGFARQTGPASLPPLPRRIYAVGEKTAEALSGLGMKARHPERQDAAGLAELILSDLGLNQTGTERQSGEIVAGKPRREEVVRHWCGNRTRENLEKCLKRGGVRLVQTEVYRTDLNRMRLPEKPVYAILFYSPSAVEAFRESIGFDRDLPPLFAIGNTTGEALGLESGKTVYIPSCPDTRTLLQLVAAVLTGADGNSDIKP